MNRRKVLNQLQELPQEVKDCEKSIREENPDMDRSTAIAICRDELEMSELEQYDLPDTLLQEDPCEEGWVMVGTKQKDGRTVPNCVPEEDADPADLAKDCPDGKVSIGERCVPMEEVDDVPPGSLSAPRIMRTNEMSTDPIEREELSDGVVFRNIKLLDEGIWTDQASRTPTLYSSDHFENYTPEFSDDFDGPPVNVMHDLDSGGEPNEASIGGHVPPDSIRAEGNGLFGDIELDTTTAAGEFADENLQSALKSGGEVGFGGPSVELDFDGQEDLQETDSPDAEVEVVRANLTGVGLVMQPASETVDFSVETNKRPVAMAASGRELKVFERKQGDMSDTEAIRKAILGREMEMDAVEDHAEMIADELDVGVDEVMEVLDPLMDMEEGGEEEAEMEEDDYDDDEDDEMEMAQEEMIEMLESLESRLDEIEAEHDELVRGDEMSQAIEDETEELAKDEEVQELQEEKKELEKRLSDIEEEPEDPRTLADSDESDWNPTYDTTPSQSTKW